MDQKHSEYGHFLDSDKPVFSRVRVKLQREGNIGENGTAPGIEVYGDDDYMQRDQIRAIIEEINGNVGIEENCLKHSIMMTGNEASK